MSCAFAAFALLVPLLLSYLSGCKSEEIHQKIVGGIESERRFIGALINKTRSRSKEIGFFAGPVVIVNDYLALTAAHTVHMMEEKSYRKGRAYIRTSCDELTNTTCIDHKVCYYSCHGDFVPRCDLKHDVAVLRVIQPFTGDGEIPATFAKFTEWPRFGYEVCGWGKALGELNPLRKSMRCAPVALISNRVCRHLYANGRGGTVTREMLCGVARNPRHVCVYNSGGPLMYNGSIVGLHSWGRWCSRYLLPGVWTDISSEQEWYNKHLDKDHDKECWRGLTYTDRMKHYFRTFMDKFRFCQLAHKASDSRRNVSMTCSFPRIFKWFG